MKTITKTFNAYSFDELEESAKDRAHSEWLSNGNAWPLEYEAVETIKAFERLFDVKLKGWEISTYRPSYPSVVFGSRWDDRCLELSGNRARAYLLNNFDSVLSEPTTRYYCKDASGKLIEAVGCNSIKRTSKVFFSRVYDGTCPLTGVCFDCNALDPMAYFCYGVEWNECEKRRTPSKCRTLDADNKNTVESVICDCAYAMFRAFNADCEYHESRECFAEDCRLNGWTFTEYGAMMNV